MSPLTIWSCGFTVSYPTICLPLYASLHVSPFFDRDFYCCNPTLWHTAKKWGCSCSCSSRTPSQKEHMQEGFTWKWRKRAFVFRSKGYYIFIRTSVSSRGQVSWCRPTPLPKEKYLLRWGETQTRWLIDGLGRNWNLLEIWSEKLCASAYAQWYFVPYYRYDLSCRISYRPEIFMIYSHSNSWKTCKQALFDVMPQRKRFRSFKTQLISSHIRALDRLLIQFHIISHAVQKQ